VESAPLFQCYQHKPVVNGRRVACPLVPNLLAGDLALHIPTAGNKLVRIPPHLGSPPAAINMPRVIRPGQPERESAIPISRTGSCIF
jgi:hypothetical protein